MAQRGRKSAAALMVPAGGAIALVQRPEPPDELTEEQARVWYAVTESLAADWFGRETHEVLAQYCRHAVAARRVAELIAQFETAETEVFDVEAYDRLLKMQEREGRALSSLATRMRLTQHATYDAKKIKGKGPAKRPWEG